MADHVNKPARPELDAGTLDILRRMVDESAAAPAPDPVRTARSGAKPAPIVKTGPVADPEPAPETRPAPARSAEVNMPNPAPEMHLAPVQPAAPASRVSQWTDADASMPAEPPQVRRPRFAGLRNRLGRVARRRDPARAEATEAPSHAEDPARWRLWMGQAAVQLRGFLKRPDAPRELAVALLAISAIVWPWFVAGFAALTIAAAAITWFTLGPDRASELIVAWHARLAERDPEKAETIRRRAARISRKITKLADRLPDRWTTGLYIPDFEPAGELPEKMKNDPFDRLAAQVHGGERPGVRA